MALDLLMSSASGQASAWPDGLASPSPGTDADTRAFLSAMADAHAAEAAARASDVKASSRAPADDEPPSLSPGRSRTALTAAAAEPSPTPVTLRGGDDDAEAVEAALLFAAALTNAPTVAPTDVPIASAPIGGDAFGSDATPIATTITTTITLSGAAGLLQSLTADPPTPGPTPGETVALTSEPAEPVAPTPTVSISLPTSSPTPALTPALTSALTLSADATTTGTSGSSSDVQYPAAASLPRHARALLQALKEQSTAGASLSEQAAAAPVLVSRLGAPSPESPALDVTAMRETGLAGASAHSSARVIAAVTASADSFTARSAAALAVAAAPLFTEPPTPGSNGGQRDSREQSLQARETLPTLAGSKAAQAVELFSLVEQSAPSSLGAIEAPESLSPGSHLPNEEAVAATLVRSMHLQYRNGVGTAVVNLDPEYLGAVTIALQVERGVVTATLHAANAEVRGWMQANESALRQGLAEQGLSLDRLVVSEEERHGEPPPEDGRRRPSQEEERQRRQSQRTDTRTFEVIV